jgi:hypothetical protein
MTSIRESIRRLLAPPKPLPPGMYPYQAPPDAPFPYRLHLRIEADGSGVLIVNAATVLHLNQTAAEYACYLIQGVPTEEAGRKAAARYKVNRAQAEQDFRSFSEQLYTLLDTPDLDPVSYLGMERVDPYAQPSAPYRLDCALTYRLPEGVDPQAAPLERAAQELSTAAWQAIIDKAFAAGIPHLIFTGGEPTLRPDLPELLAYAQSRGLVTGLLSDGLRLADPNYFNRLLETGLDHLMVVVQPDLEASWKAVAAATPADLYTTVHLTLTPANAAQAGALINRLAMLKPNAVSLSAQDLALAGELKAARQLVADLGLDLVWDLPVPYSAFNPVALEVQGQAAAPGAGRAWMYVEPDGDVLPGQGLPGVLGNLAEQEWSAIWQSSLLANP